jgi:CRP-like cAMP-binding protein
MARHQEATGMTPSPLLDDLGADARAAVLGQLRRRAYQRGQVVFNEGDEADCLHLVRVGRFAVERVTVSGQTLAVRVVHPGQFFGELAMVEPGHRRTARVTALDSAETMVLQRGDFEVLRRTEPGVDRLLVVALAERVRLTTDLALELLRPPETRIWRRLAVLAEAYGDEPIGMSQDDLAHVAGTVRQTANRVLRNGARDGILEIRRGAVRVLDRLAVDERARG